MLNNYAVFLCSHGRADEGVRNFEQAAANPLYPTPWAAFTNAGVCLRAAHRDGEAAARFDRALRSNPAYSEAVFQASDLDLPNKNLPMRACASIFFCSTTRLRLTCCCWPGELRRRKTTRRGSKNTLRAWRKSFPIRSRHKQSRRPGSILDEPWRSGGRSRYPAVRVRAWRLHERGGFVGHTGGGATASGRRARCRHWKPGDSRARGGGVRARSPAALCRTGGRARGGDRWRPMMPGRRAWPRGPIYAMSSPRRRVVPLPAGSSCVHG